MTAENTFIQAAKAGKLADVKRFLADPNVDVNHVDRTWTALGWAVYEGNVEIVRELLKNSQLDVNQPVSHIERPPLVWTAYRMQEEHFKIFQLLLADKRIDINAGDYFNKTVLMWAVINNNPTMVKTLLADERIDVSKRDNDGYTAFDLAQKSGLDKIVCLFKKHNNKSVLSKQTIASSQPMPEKDLLSQSGNIRMNRKHKKLKAASVTANTSQTTKTLWYFGQNQRG